ncbi:MAG: cobalamin-binding protein [Acidaminobacter sp.]|uniref:cobalamin B12-binding domain-containing protein n=1 Tax=Acidaminobacter sp. TaxID=1872102 RepID=UPI00137FC771|nr:cobalamin-dependent protein [Acidaminobacter sp.]MZQ99524.1 cobalamin-binding protein [Acidaminobacter sp.]
MSLLINYNDPKFIEITKIIFESHFLKDPKLHSELDDRRKKLMYDDVVYNLSFLFTAVYFRDQKIFTDYAVWIFKLLCNIMKDFDRTRIMQMMVDHYAIMSDSISNQLIGLLSDQEIHLSTEYLESAINATKNAVLYVPESTDFDKGSYAQLRDNYLESLLLNNTRDAYAIINEAYKSGVPIIDIYEEVLTYVMHEIGELWHKNIISVDKEHFATSVTQTVMGQFYDDIFSQPRKQKTLVACAIGSELHEIGIRMLSDMFEFHGWDSYYLGAALPTESILKSIDEHKPNLIALSVTMPPYLKVCETIVMEIRNKYPEVKIAVGGQAFLRTDSLWEKMNIDFYSPSAIELVKWTEKNI